MAVRGGVRQLRVEHRPHHGLLDAVEQPAVEGERRPRAGMEVAFEVLLAVREQARRRPSPACQRQRGVPAGGHAEHAHRAEVERLAPSGLLREPVDGRAHLERPPLPADRPRVAVAASVVAQVLGKRDGEPGGHQGAGQLDVHPRRRRRTVRDDHQAAVARGGRRFGGGVEHEGSAVHPGFSRLRGIEDGHGAGGRAGGQLRETHAGLRGVAEQGRGEEGDRGLEDGGHGANGLSALEGCRLERSG